MNILAGVLLFICCTYIGIGIERAFKLRIDFLKELSCFLSYFESEILHLKTDIPSIFDKYIAAYGGKLSEVLKNVSDPTALKIDDIKIAYLSAQDKQWVVDFLFGISQMSIEGQDGFLQAKRNELEKYLSDGEKDHTMKGKLAKKLAPVLGIGIMIIVM